MTRKRVAALILAVLILVAVGFISYKIAWHVRGKQYQDYARQYLSDTVLTSLNYVNHAIDDGSQDYEAMAALFFKTDTIRQITKNMCDKNLPGGVSVGTSVWTELGYAIKDTEADAAFIGKLNTICAGYVEVFNAQNLDSLDYNLDKLEEEFQSLLDNFPER